MKNRDSFIATIGHIKYNLTKNISEKYISKIRYRFLKKKGFTIISNNCWGGWVYRTFGLEYQSPTVGLFIMPDDFLKFVNNLEYYLNECELDFIDPESSKYYDELKTHEKFGEYPIGLLGGDVEINFLHYKSRDEAYEKWNRRAKRIHWDNLIIKFNDQNGCSKEQIDYFNNITKYRKMICFVSKKYVGRYNIYMWEFKKDGYVVDDKWWCRQHLNLKKLIEKSNF